MARNRAPRSAQVVGGLRSGLRRDGSRWYMRGGRFISGTTYRRSAAQRVRNPDLSPTQRQRLRTVLEQTKAAKAAQVQPRSEPAQPVIAQRRDSRGRFLPRTLENDIRGQLADLIRDGAVEGSAGFVTVNVAGQQFRARGAPTNILRAIGGGIAAAYQAARGEEFNYDAVSAAADAAEAGDWEGLLDMMGELADAQAEFAFELAPDDL